MLCNDCISDTQEFLAKRQDVKDADVHFVYEEPYFLVPITPEYQDKMGFAHTYYEYQSPIVDRGIKEDDV